MKARNDEVKNMLQKYVVVGGVTKKKHCQWEQWAVGPGQALVAGNFKMVTRVTVGWPETHVILGNQSLPIGV
jgi:hypothetical protein